VTVRAGRMFACGALAVLVVSSVALARPVRIGRYTEIPYGIDAAHSYATGLGDARRTGRVNAEAPRALPRLLWEARLRAGRPSAPAVSADGILFVSTTAGLTALDQRGAVLWTLRLGALAGTPSLTPTGDVAVGVVAGALAIVSARGDVLSRTPVGGAVRGASLVLVDGSVVMPAFDQAVHRFDADGRRLFRTAMDYQVVGSPAWSPRGEILVPTADRVVSLSSDGEVRGSASVGAGIVAGPAVADDGSIWLLSQDAVLHQLSPDLRLRTRTELTQSVTPANAFAIGHDGAVRVGTRGGALVCVGPNGTERWRLDSEGGFLGGVSIDRSDVTLAVNDDGLLLAVDHNGAVLWRVQTGNRSDAAPVLGPDGTIYVATMRGTVQAFR